MIKHTLYLFFDKVDKINRQSNTITLSCFEVSKKSLSMFLKKQGNRIEKICIENDKIK